MKLRKYDPKKPKIKHSPAQKWAHERNWNKAQLIGIKGNLNRIASYNTSTLVDEKGLLLDAFDKIAVVLDNWDFANKFSKDRYLLIENLKNKEVKQSEAAD